MLKPKKPITEIRSNPNPKIYYKKVFPKGGLIVAQICYEGSSSRLGRVLPTEVIAFSKNFGYSYQQTPLESNYKDAKIWADKQLKMISGYTTEKTRDEIPAENITKNLDDFIK